MNRGMFFDEAPLALSERSSWHLPGGDLKLAMVVFLAYYRFSLIAEGRTRPSSSLLLENLPRQRTSFFRNHVFFCRAA